MCRNSLNSLASQRWHAVRLDLVQSLCSLMRACPGPRSGVLHPAPDAVAFLVEMLRASRKIGDDEAGIGAHGGRLDAGDDAAFS